MAMFAKCCRGMLAVALCVAVGAQAQEAKEQARAGAVADGVSSFVGVAAGVPVNPLLPVLGLGFKAATLYRAETLPETERPRAYALAAASWQGSAAANACAAVSVLSGGSFLPACLVVGVAWGWSTWKDSERERLDAEHCAALRVSTHKPGLRCAAARKAAAAHAGPRQAKRTPQKPRPRKAAPRAAAGHHVPLRPA